jgi:lipid kinase YegS
LGLQIRLVVRPSTDGSQVEELRAAVAALRRDGHRVGVRVTFEAGDARRYARRAALCGSQVVVAAGGDGTINEVVNGLVAAPAEVALAVVPLGTGNDFARMLGLPDDVEACLRVAVDGVAVPVDVAAVNRRCFINVSTGGFGAEPVKLLNRDAKGRLGRMAYVLSGAQRLANLEAGDAVFRADGVEIHRGSFFSFAVGNARWTGGGTLITPEADPGDGRLDVVIVTGESRLDFLALLPDLRAGTHLGDPDVLYVRARTFEVESSEAIPVNADGEAVAGRRFRYSVLERRVPVMIPRGA